MKPLPKIDIHLLRTLIVNVITLGVAAGLALNRRNNSDISVSRWTGGEDAPFVSIIIPARNEARNITPLLKSLLAQRYPAGRWSVTVVDDASDDGTSTLASRIAQGHPHINVITAPPLPAGWTGKNHAMHTGYLASPKEAEWLLFVDADTRHHPDMLSSVVNKAANTGADVLSLIINVEMRSFWERVMVPQVGELYTLLVGTMDSVNNPNGAAAANGQFLLIRRELYAQIGASKYVRTDVAEDRAIAAACKERGATVRLEYGRNLVRARVYASLKEMWEGYSKTLFWASGHDIAKTLLVATALTLYALVPPLSLLYALLNPAYKARNAALKHAPAQLIPMHLLRIAVCRQMGIPSAYALTYPLGVAVGNAMLLFSLYRVVSGKGVRWKGRTYYR
ncbi:MAG TPA: glycosyltransferase [Chloroflexia bacterium]|nr:glycosyltransferase [Chloroflexia bacterium]